LSREVSAPTASTDAFRQTFAATLLLQQQVICALAVDAEM
jgi:hypothetical protein